ncbi:tRNA lysidine(34) synthetase TilS [Paracoccaceae bacterium Fryx2]|nr:tRNA lysidine(34) synthetase TilS [Paracoccaceae bacterium Fryx2]
MSVDDAGLLACLGPVLTGAPLGLAVSGGGDSMAMLHLAVRAGADRGLLHVVTVDHGLRAESADEARFVGRVCAGLGVAHVTLRWTGWDGQGNTADQARRARYGLMADWARATGIGRIALAHTRDDQAETFLMRLARKAGVDGLAAMAPCRVAHGIAWLRPLLGVGRADLRRYLSGAGLPWIDDPGNDDLRHDRVKARAALAVLDPLGIGAGTLAEVARNLAVARQALDEATRAAARRCCRVDGGDVVFDRTLFGELPAEIRRRLMERALRWVASAEYGPRAAALAGFVAAACGRQPMTLHGCRLLPGTSAFRICREVQAVKHLATPADKLWDGRWQFSGADSNGLQVRALGACGLAQLPDWRGAGRPRAALLAAPALWRNDTVVAAPLAGRVQGWHLQVKPDAEGLFLSALSH